MNDPFVNEVRQSRHEHAQQFHDDVSAICDDVRHIHATCGQAVVTCPPKRVSTSARPPKVAMTVEHVAA